MRRCVQPASATSRRPDPLYILDTNTVTAHQHLHPTVVARLTRLAPNAVATTVVTLHEQLRGRMAAVSSPRDDDQVVDGFERLRVTLAYFCTILVLPFDGAAAAIVRGLRARKIRIGTQDLRIAAITLANDAILVTGNRRDFERIPGLRLEDWTIA